MSTSDHISRLERLGIRLWVEDDRLHYDAPAGTISEMQAELIQQKSEILKSLLKAEEIKKSRRPALRPISRSSNAPLSFVQMRLWFLDQFEPRSSVYNIPSAVRLEGVLMRELSALYAARCQGEPSPLPALPVQYADYAIWQRDCLQGEVLEKQLSYWRQQLKDLPVLDLPTDRPRPATQSFRGAQFAVDLPAALTQGLEMLSQRAEGTLFMTLLAAFQVLLQRYSGQDDIVVGSPIAGRNKVEVEELIGFFVNTLVLRTDLSGDPTFMELLGRVREVALGAYAHQDLPFDKLVEELQPERDLSRNPLFDVLINFIEGMDDTENISRLPGLRIFSEKPCNVLSKFTFTLYIRLIDGRLRMELVYQEDIFDSDRMRCLLQQFQYLLEQIVAMPEQTIQSYSLITPESGELLPDPTVVLDEPQQQTVSELFSETAARFADNVAVSQNGKHWTYDELNKASLRLAAALRVQGTESGDVIAVSGHRSYGLIVSIVAALRAGGVILPMDKSLPSGRQEIMYREARASMILSVGGDVALSSGLRSLCVDAETGCLKGDVPDYQLNATDLPGPSADDPAYIFFTSGSTGTPKAVLGCHKSLSHFLHWQREHFSVGPDDRVAQLTSISFDVVLRDIFLPLLSGGTVCLPDDNDLVKTLHWVEREGITVIHSVPAVTRSWLANRPKGLSLRSLRWLFLAGEPLTDALVRQWRSAFPESGAIVNLYGATETTMVKCFCQLGDEIEEGIQLAGKALPQTQALVLQGFRVINCFIWKWPIGSVCL